VLQRCFISRLSGRLARGQVSFAQYTVLCHLSGGPLSMSGIAQEMRHSTAAATGLVDRLEDLGYVQRVREQGDRRKGAVRITRKGQQLVGRIREDIHANLGEFIGCLTPAQQRTWLEIYEKLLAFCLNRPEEP
ncbi:MAG: MarR family transcriptional regulator, partial [Terrimicrobiaceae bacterium]|nr:MarR family transcriptional regulator [Terrimicrobiaceae bacterium]